MNGYKKWDGTQRQESLKLFNLAKKAGLIESPKECKICGQTKGILMTYNKNYDVTLSYLPKLLDGKANEMEISLIHKALVPICWRCHRHSLIYSLKISLVFTSTTFPFYFCLIYQFSSSNFKNIQVTIQICIP